MADSKEPVKKELSGYEYRKRKAEKEKRFQVSKKSMMIDKYFIGKSQELESVIMQSLVLPLLREHKY